MFYDMGTGSVSKALVIRRVPTKVELRPNVVNTLSRDEVAAAAKQTKKLHRPLRTGEFSRALGYKNNNSFRSSMGPLKKYGISKTFIPGHGYISATKVVELGGKGALRAAVKDQKTMKAKVAAAEKGHFDEYRKVHQANKDHLRDLATKGKQTPSPTKGVVFQRPDRMTGWGMKANNIEAYAIKTGGRKTGTATMVVPKGSTGDTIAHEVAHLTPKRSGYRLYKVLSNPNTLAREEARADMATRTASGY